MPKGKGMLKDGGKIGEALKADLESLNGANVSDAFIEGNTSPKIQRINITIDDALLKLTDRRVFELKQQGEKSSRSQLISEGLKKLLGV